MKRKILSLLLCLVLVCSFTTGCGDSRDDDRIEESDDEDDDENRVNMAIKDSKKDHSM